jgi:hypothetical protein
MIIHIFEMWGTALGAYDWLIPIWTDIVLSGTVVWVVVVMKVRGIAR